MSDPSHVDLSVLWVPIMPETSKLGDAMEQVGKDATESFGKGSSGIGDKIHDSITKSKDKLKDVFHRSGNEASEAIADGVRESSKKVEDAVEESGKKAQSKFGEAAKGWGKVLVDAVGPDTKKLLGDRLEETVGGALEGVLGENAKWAGKFSHTVADWGFDELKGKLGGVKDAADKTKAAFADFGSGDTTAGVLKLVDGFGKLGLEVKDLPQPVQDVVGKVTEAKLAAEGFADVFTNLPGKIGSVASQIAGLAGPIAALGATVTALWPQEKAGLFDKTDSGGHEDWWKLAGGVGGSWLEDKYNHAVHGHGTPGSGPAPGVDMGGVGGIGTGGDVLGSNADGYGAFSGAPDAVPHPFVAVPPRPSPLVPPAASAPTPTPVPIAPTDMPSSFVGSMPSLGSPSDLHRAGGNVSNLYRVAQALQGTPYSQALRNDCSGMVSKLATAALGMPPSVQFSTVNEGDWLGSHGFKPGMGGPGDLSVGWYDHGGGNAGHTAATLPDGTHAESGGSHGDFALGAGAAGADNPEFEHHAHLSMDGSTDGGQKMPSGAQHDPLYVMPADTGSSGSSGGGGGGSDAQDLSGQLGQGLLGGIAQSVGLDGSVFKGFGGASNPMNFGITKLATGLLNHASHGAGVSQNAIPVGPGGAQTGSAGATVTNHIDNSFTANGIGTPQEQKEAFNAKPPPVSSGVPGGGGFPSAGVP